MPSDLDTMGQRLPEESGPRFWRGVEELCETEEFRAMMRREFPEQAETWTDPVTRRQFLMLMGASFALAGISGCSPRPAPAEKIMPYVRQPEALTQGKPLWYATAMTLGGVATGLLVKSHEGRPTKVEGNPKHPGSLGASDVFAQASILELYDPDRSKSVTYRGQPRGWSDFVSVFSLALERQRKRRGAGLRVVTQTIGSPTLITQLESILANKDFAEARWIQYEPAGRNAALEGSQQAFDALVQPIYHFRDADVILALDSDFLTCGPGHLRYVREFADRRRVRVSEKPLDQATMNRLYVAESMMTPTGAKADHRLPLGPSRIVDLASAVAAELKVMGVPPPGELTERERKWAAAVARDLGQHRGRSLVLTGDGQPAQVHALVHALNAALGNLGTTVTFTQPVGARHGNQFGDLHDLARDMEQGLVELLLLIGVNPVYNAPTDLEFATRLQNMPANALRVHMGLYQDETAIRCDWHIPEAHYLESWSDGRAFDGTASIVQPLIAPLYDGRTAHELLALFQEGNERPGYEIVRETWRKHFGSGDFEAYWRKALRDGVIPDTAFSAKKVTLRADWSKPVASRVSGQSMEIVFRPDHALYDGRFANNGWLQELPRPITRLTWDNGVYLSPATAKKLGLEQSVGPHGGEHGEAIVDLVELRYRGRTLTLPAWVVPGHADEAVTIDLGHGRSRAGHVGSNVGFSAYQLRTSEAPWFDAGVELHKTGGSFTAASVQMHHRMEGREPVRTTTLDAFKRDSAVTQQDSHHQTRGDESQENDRRLHPLTMYDPFPYEGYKWAMLIDLTACVGCSACVVACQAENNIPVVGKTEVTRGREMHWLRIDRYFTGPVEDPVGHFQPVPCMHCELAPCEYVCPVNATVHSHDGLNDMVYNRCVGTRFCQNNCPYKVRRFNFFQYSDYTTGSLQLLHNPDVTVRSRGVMEKCTYCVQRIRNVEITAEREGRRIRDGEMMTACQQACPAQAIIFGDLNDKQSRVRQWKSEPLEYGLLDELNTKPRTTYLASLRNPNQEGS